MIRRSRRGGNQSLYSLPHLLMVALVLAIGLLIAPSHPSCWAFSPPPRSNNLGFFRDGDEGGDDDSFGFIPSRSALLGALISAPSSLSEEERLRGLLTNHVTCTTGSSIGDELTTRRVLSIDPTLLQLRGGGGPIGGMKQKISQKRDDMVDGCKKAIDDTLSYWGGALEFFDTRFLPGGRARQGKKEDSNTSKAAKSTQRRGKRGRGKMTKEEREAMKQIDTVAVKSVTAPNSTLLTSSVLTDAGRRSGLIGGKFLPEAVENCAARLGQWYSGAGYILNSVTGATLDADTGTAKLVVDEASVSSNPVDVICVREVAVDERTGETMSIGAYRRKLALEGDGSIQSFNTTLVEAKGRTRPSALAGALNLRPGEPFKWDRAKWEHIELSDGGGLFSRVWSVSPTKTPDGTVQLRVVASEAPARNIEYGVTKSLYNDLWEGELDFSHGNLFGGGERLGFMVRRGTSEPQASFNVKFIGNTLSDKGPYDVEAFNEFIGVAGHEGGASSRRGLTVRFPNVFPRTTASASIEKTLAKTKTGEHDRLAHANFNIGPFLQKLPANGRSNIQATVNVGAKLDVGKIRKGGRSILDGMAPYSTYTATTQQIVPLNSPSKATGRPIALALSHRATAATSELPEHEALAIGFAGRVRGYSSRKNGPLSSSIVGTAEIRIPVPLPTNNLVDDGGVVLFGDWMMASRWSIRDIKNKAVGSASAALLSKPARKSSVGIGLRSVLQGIPVKVDFSLTDDGRVGTHLGLGRDFAA